MKSESYTYKVRGYTFVEHEYDKHMECDVFSERPPPAWSEDHL